ncbi:MAG TPA: prolipoprotein diacylglyceryl transferase family protein [Terriglobales bacterium]|nr:prolipoprotein diacylglyceryl transferase family protein [Terriglobales bacterium]
MLPAVRHIWGMAFTLYDVMRVAAIAAALATCVLLNRRQGISSSKTLLIAAVCVPLSIGGARLLNAIEYGATLTNWYAEFLRDPGSSIYGALVACVVAVVAMTRALRIPTLRFLDSGGPAIALGEGVSRIGCFCAGCCYGKPWNGPWAVVFPPNSFAAMDQRYRGLLGSGTAHSLAVHPVQLYGVVLMALLTWGLVWYFRRPHTDGTVFWLLLIAYGAYRLAITPFRTEVLASMEAFSLVFIAAGILGLLWSNRTTLTT